MSRSIVLIAALLLAGPAGAHGTLPGGGGFYAGAAHPFLAWEHLLALLAVGLLVGRWMGVAGRLPLVSLAASLGLGLLLGALGYGAVSLSAVALALATLGGVGLALAAPLPRVVPALAAAVGLVVGLDTGVPAPTSTGVVEVYAPYLGVVAGVFLIVLNAAALASVAVRPPFPIALRVAGSWIAAAALMVLAFEYRRLVGTA